MAKKKPKVAIVDKRQPVIEPAVELENADTPDSGEISPLEAVAEEAEAELGEQPVFEGEAVEESGGTPPLSPTVEEAESEFGEQPSIEGKAMEGSAEAAPPVPTVEEVEAELDEQPVLEGEVVEENGEVAPPTPIAEEVEAATDELGEETPVPLDLGGERFVDLDSVVVPFDKINEILAERQAAARRGRKAMAEEQQDEAVPQGEGAPSLTEEAQETELSDFEAEEPSVEQEALTQEERDAAFIQEKINQYRDSDAQKALEPDDGLTLKERKQKLEKELREKYGIPKSDKPVAPWVTPEVEQVVRIPHEQIHSFKGHPFNVEKNSKFMAFVASILAHGVTQPAVVRPDGKDGYEMISGHRRDLGSIEAEIPYTPCIIRALNDDQAIQQMVEDNVNNREISTMELARALKMQLDALKHQGARTALQKKEYASDIDKRSNEIVAERNGMSVKQVQRHISLTDLIPSLQRMMDGVTLNGGKTIRLAFTPAVEISYISPKNQEYIAIAVEGQQAAPSLSQAQRLKELDKKGILNSDMIDGILLEEKKEVDKVIISSQELGQFFGKDKTPREMKEQIMALLDEWKQKQPELSMPEKKQAQEL